MKKDNRTQVCGALLITCGAAAMIWAALRTGGDNLAWSDTKSTVSEKQAMLKEFFPTNPKQVALGFFGAMTLIGGVSIINKSKEK